MASRTDARNERTPIIVRYIPYDDGDWSDEIAETLDQFLEAITGTDESTD